LRIHDAIHEASRILTLFAGLGVQPRVDYVCDRGRTRVLEFPIPSEHESIAYLCRRVLSEVYSMRRGDVLDYHPLKRQDVPPRQLGGRVSQSRASQVWEAMRATVDARIGRHDHGIVPREAADS
jgi:hypothetical protein